MEITEDDLKEAKNIDNLKKLLEKTYYQGQLDGIALACDQISLATLEFKETLISEFKKITNKR